MNKINLSPFILLSPMLFGGDGDDLIFGDEGMKQAA